MREDLELMRKGRAKYLGDDLAESSLAVVAIKSIGLQMMLAIRTMHLLRDVGMPQGAQVTSRLIRYVYGAEIHWQSTWEGGVNIVHGNGLVVGSGAHIEHGCVLLHNVTLGDAFDPVSNRIGGPHLLANVHVGPGSTLLGPIEVGENSKVMAGSILDRSVPPGSLVKPAPSSVSGRDASA